MLTTFNKKVQDMIEGGAFEEEVDELLEMALQMVNDDGNITQGAS